MKRTESRVILLAVPLCVGASIIIAAAGTDDLQSLWASIANWFLALGALFFAVSVAPTFAVGRVGKIAAMMFFAATAFRHGAAALFYVVWPNSELQSSAWFFATVTVAQAASLWIFVLGIREATIANRARLAALRGKPEVGRRATDRAGDSSD